MNLAKTLTRTFPTENRIGIHLILTDSDRPDLGENAQIVVNETFEANIPVDADISNKVQVDLGTRAQAAINKYKKLADYYAKPAYETKVDQIDNNLQL